MEIHADTWVAGLTIAERGLVVVVSLSLFFGLPLLALLAFGRRGRGSRGEAYGVYLGIMTAILVVGVVLSIMLQVLSGLAAWIIGSLGFVATGGVAVLLVIAVVGAYATDNRGRARTRNRWSLVAVISGAVLAILVLRTPSGFSMSAVAGIAVSLTTAIVMLFVVIAVVQALSSGRDRPRRWWLVGALLATAVVGVLLVAVIDQLAPDRSDIEAISQSFAECYVVAAVVCVFVFPVHIGRALYKVFYGDDVTVTHTRKAREQREYATAGYRCGKCGRSLATPAPQCPHCGVRFAGKRNEYLRGTPPPKPTTTTSRNATPLAGVLLLVLLGLDMLYGVALFEIRDLVAHSDDMTVYVVGAVIANALIIAAAVVLVRRYAVVNGRVEQTSYY